MNQNLRGARFESLLDILKGSSRVGEILRADAISRSEFFSEFAKTSRPFIQRKSSDSRDAFQRISSQFGDRIVKVRLGDYADPYHYAPERRQLQEMKIVEYVSILDKVSADGVPPPYAGNFSVPVEFLSSIGVGAPTFYPANSFEPPTVWLGAKGSITPLHRDSTDNFTFQLMGRKRWVIFPPQDDPYLYMRHVAASAGGDFATSDVDLRRPDLVRFPEFVKAKPIEFILEEGDMLYLPMGWAHFVENLSKSLMVNYWRSVKPSGIGALE